MDKFSILDQVDNFAEFRNSIRRLADAVEEYAGIPMPLDDQQLVIEPKYPHYNELMSVAAKPPEIELPNIKLRNTFWSAHLRTTVYVYDDEDGKVRCTFERRIHNFVRELNALGCSHAWGLEQEAQAMQTLAGLLRHHQFKTYLLTGMFLERSKRSGLTYLFRKLKPTVVLDARDPNGDTTRILCALCMHPIAYYSDTWAGAMTPTDDVIAHLMLMRGDERMFWKRSNQHPPERLEAGL